MNRKKLPKAILETSVGLYAAEPGSGVKDVGSTSAAPSVLGNGAAHTVEPAGNVVPITPLAQRASVRIATLPSRPATPLLDMDMRQRRAKALAIVNRHTAYSAAGGLIPLPLINFAGVTAIIVRMVKALSRHYGVPFQRDRARAIVIGLIGGAVPSGAATIGSSALLYVLPPSVLMAAAMSSASAAAFTRSIGRIFVSHFENGATLDEPPAIQGG